MGLLNVRSLNTGKDELICSMEQLKPDILALNETWLKDGGDLCAPSVPGYHFKHTPRANGMRGGGVGFYVRRGTRARVRPHPASPLEQMWLEVALPGGVRIAVGTVYRAESEVSVQNAIDALSESLNVFEYCSHIFVLSDFNVDLLMSDRKSTVDFMSFLSQRNMEQVVKEPTRVTDQSSTLLDLIITDSPALCKGISVHHNPLLSDHAFVSVQLSIKKYKASPRFHRFRNLNKVNETDFIRDLGLLPWSEVEGGRDVNDMVARFNDLITQLFNKHAPIRRVRVRERPHPWLTDNIKLMMSLRDRALIKARSTKLDIGTYIMIITKVYGIWSVTQLRGKKPPFLIFM